MKQFLSSFFILISLLGNSQDNVLNIQNPERLSDCDVVFDSVQASEIHTIISLKITAPDEMYGFSEKFPIKVGTGPQGGPANQRRYLELLRDAKGKPIKYKRIGSCCAYESENGLFGMALVDKYEISFLNAKGKKRNAYVYISFYDYEEPMILVGFTSAQ